MNDFMENFTKEVIDSGLSSWFAMQECWSLEIKGVETHFNIKLPTIYKDFLKKMGKGAGKFMQGTDFFYHNLFDNRKAIEEVLELENFPFSLQESYFVFSSHQGYNFFFFDTNEDAYNPPVYVYQEGELKFEKVDETLTAFLQRLLEEQITAWNNLID